MLDNMMLAAVRTKEGAEATLNDNKPMSVRAAHVAGGWTSLIPIQSAFRNLVELELQQAKERIEDLSRKIEERAFFIV